MRLLEGISSVKVEGCLCKQSSIRWKTGRMQWKHLLEVSGKLIVPLAGPYILILELESKVTKKVPLKCLEMKFARNASRALPTPSHFPITAHAGSQMSSPTSDRSSISIINWDENDVQSWLTGIGFPQYESQIKSRSSCLLKKLNAHIIPKHTAYPAIFSVCLMQNNSRASESPPLDRDSQFSKLFTI